MASVAQEGAFFVTGGTIPAAATSYVERAADGALFESMSAGKFCYVLNSRQMGKSSLCVRTMRRLEADGVRCAFIDLTGIGGSNVSAQQWYAGITIEIGRALNLRSEFLAFWKGQPELNPMQRLFAALREVALTKISGNVAVFFDEIDATRALSFSTDEFFAGIRECYNRRVQDEAFNRLTFCLLGVAVPSDLINSATSTPFNIGERIYLRDFTLEEALPLAAGLETPHAEALVRRVYHWTNGHPYLTQSLCAALAANASIIGPDAVDDLIRRDLFDAAPSETDINLADVANRALHAGDFEPAPDKFRADLLSAYERAWLGKPLADDESNRVTALLKLSGIMRSERNRLYVRNRIYQRCFDRTWVRDNMPGQELRRQRRAYWRGVMRTAAVSAVVVGTIGWLAYSRRVERDAAEYLNYTTTMRLIPEVWKGHNLTKVEMMIDQTADSPHRGWEWDYWNRVSHQDTFRLRTSGHFWFPAISPDGKAIWYSDQGFLWRLDVPTRTTTRLFRFPDAYCLTLLPDGAHLLAYFTAFGANASVVDVRTGGHLPLRGTLLGWDTPTPDGRSVVGVLAGRLTKWDVATGEPTALTSESDFLCAELSADGRRLVVSRRRNGADELALLSYPDCKAIGTFGQWSSYNLAISPDGRLLSAFVGNEVRVWEMDSRKQIWHAVAATTDFADMPRFSQDAWYLMVSTSDRELKLYERRNQAFVLAGSFPESTWSSMSPDDSTIAIQYDAGYGSEFRFLNWKRYHENVSFTVPNAVECRSYPDGDRISLIRQNSLVLLDPLTGRKVREVFLPANRARNGLNQVQRPEDAMLVRTPDGGEVIECETGKTLMKELPARYFVANSQDALAVSWIDAEHFLIPCVPEPMMDLWDRRTHQLVRSIRLGGTTTALSMSPDKGTIAVGLDNGAVMLYDTRSWTARKLAVEPWYATHLHFSPDGRYLLAGLSDDFGVAYNLASGKATRTMTHEQIVWDIDISPDHKRLVTCSADRTVRLWDAATGAELTTLTGHTGSVFYVRFTSDGRSIVSWGADGVRTWTLKS